LGCAYPVVAVAAINENAPMAAIVRFENINTPG
jgi:hypothetical protein